jgi:dihydrofolate reductase
MVTIVVAHASNRVIGRAGALPWRLPGDLRRFRELTLGHAVLMGRRTFESLPDAYRPLPERRNLVLSRDPGRELDGAEVFGELEAALAACGGECFVIGGEQAYRAALARCERVYATELASAFEGDARFPELPASEWRRVEEGAPIVENDIQYSFRTYERAV